MSTCDATTLERIRHSRSVVARSAEADSTKAAAVSSQDVSIPSTSIGQTLKKRRLEHAALSDDRGDVFVRRDVERGIAHLRAVRRELIRADVRHLTRVALLD